MARELDVHAALWLHEEELKREYEREERDREFWVQMFGGSSSKPQEIDFDQLIQQRG